MTDAQQINQNSSDVEYYTQPTIIDAARWTMGGIDLDPASCDLANRTVKAARYFGINDDGMQRDWSGRVWLNHPFGRRENACDLGCQKDHVHHDYPLYGNAAWVDKLVEEFRSKRVEQACSITFAATSEAWFQPLADLPQCFLCPRTNYRLPTGELKKGVTKGSVVTYLGPNVTEFANCFRKLGKVKIPYGYSL